MDLKPTALQLTYTQLPGLYYTVDLSSHNSSKTVQAWGHGDGMNYVPTTFVEREWEDVDKHAFTRQKLFILAMQRDRKYVKHVRKLH